MRRLTEVVRRQHLALATKRTFCAWLRRYRDCLKGLPLHLPSEHKLERFLTVPVQEDVAASTESQAGNPADRSNCLPPGLAVHDPLDKFSEGPVNFGRRSLLRSVNCGRRSSQNSTLQNSLAVKSSDHSWLLRRYFRFSGGVFAKR